MLMMKARKLIGTNMLIFGTVFVCTIFGSYYLDLSSVELPDIPQIKGIYEAQLTMMKIICYLASGCLGLISMLVALFNINRHINENQSAMGVLKALGYSNLRISSVFLKVGFYIFGGAVLGYVGGILVAPAIYKEMANTKNFMFDLSFHASIPICLIGGVVVLFSIISFLFAYIKLRKSALSMIKTEAKCRVNTKRVHRSYKENSSYLKEIGKTTLSNHKILIFFIGFASFGFSSQIQLPFTMIGSSMADTSMSTIITAICFPIGILLGSVTLLIAGEFIIHSNRQSIAIMKAFGYTDKECSNSLLDAYRLPAYIGFFVGTAYQYGLIKLFVSLFADTYTLDIPFSFLGFVVVFFIFLIGYELVMYSYKRKLSKISLKQIMESNL